MNLTPPSLNYTKMETTINPWDSQPIVNSEGLTQKIREATVKLFREMEFTHLVDLSKWKHFFVDFDAILDAYSQDLERGETYALSSELAVLNKCFSCPKVKKIMETALKMNKNKFVLKLKVEGETRHDKTIEQDTVLSAVFREDYLIQSYTHFIHIINGVKDEVNPKSSFSILQKRAAEGEINLFTWMEKSLLIQMNQLKRSFKIVDECNYKPSSKEDIDGYRLNRNQALSYEMHGEFLFMLRNQAILDKNLSDWNFLYRSDYCLKAKKSDKQEYSCNDVFKQDLFDLKKWIELIKSGKKLQSKALQKKLNELFKSSSTEKLYKVLSDT